MNSSMSKANGPLGFVLRRLSFVPVQRKTTAKLPSCVDILHKIHSNGSFSYCQRRHFMASEKLAVQRMYFHSSAVHQRKQKANQQVIEETPESEDSSLVQNASESASQQLDENYLPPSELQVTERLKPPKPVIEERESSLPTHDTKRITEESRKLERKANALFVEMAETRGASKETFKLAVQKFVARENVYWRGSVEFIYAGLQEMEKFGVLKDMDSYKTLLEAFPEGKMIPRNAWQVEFMHYPRHQQCGIDLLEQMEHNAIIPDEDFGVIIKNRFGREAHVTRKLRRMMYWLPKFKNINPYPMPMELPTDPRELALMALRRMSVDRETTFNIYETVDLELEPEEDTWVASAQSPTQQHLIKSHKKEQPLFVEGPYPVYLRELRQNYFLLRAEPNINALIKQKQQVKEDEDDENLFEWKNFFDSEEAASELQPILSIHEQEDSTVLALSITGSGTKSSVMSWVRALQHTNPHLGQIPILFKIDTKSEEEEMEDGGQLLDVIGDNRPYKEMVENLKISDK